MTEFDIGDQPRVRARFMANRTELAVRVDAGATDITLFSVSGIAMSDVLLINPGAKTEESCTVSAVNGRVVTLTAPLSFSHASGQTVGEVVDPTTVELKHSQPDGTASTYTYALSEITKDSTGIYSKLLILAAAGRHVVRWTTTGPVVLMEETEFVVRESAF